MQCIYKLQEQLREQDGKIMRLSIDIESKRNNRTFMRAHGPGSVSFSRGVRGTADDIGTGSNNDRGRSLIGFL